MPLSVRIMQGAGAPSCVPRLDNQLGRGANNELLLSNAALASSCDAWIGGVAAVDLAVAQAGGSQLSPCKRYERASGAQVVVEAGVFKVSCSGTCGNDQADSVLS
jgi:hypothetical protein